MDCEIITIGNELTSGLRVDTNSAYLARKLLEVGVECKRQVSVRDDISEIADSAKQALDRTDSLFITGGLGSTVDDITREGLAEAVGSSLVFNSKVADLIDGWFGQRDINTPQEAYRQAYLPKGAKPIMPAEGTAPGIMLELGKKIVFALPGVPQEAKAMFKRDVLPYLSTNFNLKKEILVRTIKTCGTREALIAKKIKKVALRHQGELNVASLPHLGEVHIRLIAKTTKKAKRVMKQAENELVELLGEKVFGFDDDTLQSVIGDSLKRNKLTLAAAESCTGGLLGHLVTQVSGSSDYFWGGVVAYSNEAKREILRLSDRVLQEKGAVSRETALAMAKKVRLLTGVDLGIGITGIAGPTGGSLEKPTGLVFIALSSSFKNSCRQFLFTGRRDEVKIQSAAAALNMLRLFLINDLARKG